MRPKRAHVGLLVVPVVLMAAVAGCDACGGDVDPAVEAAREWDPGPVPDDVPRPNGIYQLTYEEALEKLTLEGAADRLQEIERDIARERRGLQ